MSRGRNAISVTGGTDAPSVSLKMDRCLWLAGSSREKIHRAWCWKLNSDTRSPSNLPTVVISTKYGTTFRLLYYCITLDKEVKVITFVIQDCTTKLMNGVYVWFVVFKRRGEAKANAEEDSLSAVGRRKVRKGKDSLVIS